MNESVQIDLREIARVLLKRAWLIVLCAVILGAGVLVYTVNFVTPMYQSHVKLYINNSYEGNGEAVSSSDLAVALHLVNSYVVIVEEDVVLEKVIDRLGLNMTVDQLAGMITASVVGETEIMRVTVTTPNPQMSADIANAIASIAPDTVSAFIPGSYAVPLNVADVPSHRSAPNYVTNALLGLVAGAVLAVVAILISMRFDVHIKNEAALEELCEVSVLGVIPDFTEASRTPVKKVRR